MSIDVESETLIEFQHASGAFPGERSPAIATLHRWRQKGVRGVKLETVLIGGIRYTSREAIARFIAAQNAVDRPATPTITASQRRKQSEAARTELEKMGVRGGLNCTTLRPTKHLKMKPRVARE